MFRILSLVALLLANYSVSSIEEYEDFEEIERSLINYGLLIELDLDKAPLTIATVEYPRAAASLGNTIDLSQVGTAPTVSWNADPDKFYTLLMIYPSRALKFNFEYVQIKHWLVVNIPGNRVEEGKVLATYLPPTPIPAPIPEDDQFRLHRYVFLIYDESDVSVGSEGIVYYDGETKINSTTIRDRIPFRVDNFANEYNLRDPVAGNFFTVEKSFTDAERQSFSFLFSSDDDE